nr:hypothetical protein CFP56_11825 [Quercus suber]
MASASAAALRSAGHPPNSSAPPPPVPPFVEMRDFAAPMTAPSAPLALSTTLPGSTAASQSHPQPPPMQSSSTLGPAIEGPPVIISPSHPDALVLSITLMTNTGARHPYRIDEKYLSARSVAARTAADTFDPRELKGYSLKELIWTDWREEWEPRPVSPDKIRLIILGKLVDDKKALKGRSPSNRRTSTRRTRRRIPRATNPSACGTATRSKVPGADVSSFEHTAVEADAAFPDLEARPCAKIAASTTDAIGALARLFPERQPVQRPHRPKKMVLCGVPRARFWSSSSCPLSYFSSATAPKFII